MGSEHRIEARGTLLRVPTQGDDFMQFDVNREWLATALADRYNAHAALVAERDALREACEEALRGLNRLHALATKDGSIIGDSAFSVVEAALALGGAK